MQKTTPWIQEIINCIESNIDSPQSRKWNRKYTLKDGLLYLKEKGKWTNPLKVVLPDDNPLLDKLVHQFHDSPHLAGHAGVEKTLQLLAERAHWKNMRETVQQIEGKKREEDMKEVWDKAKDAIEMNNEKSKKKFERSRRVKKREIKKVYSQYSMHRQLSHLQG
ncbi:hypothetical protein PRIPAC_84455 [Pristionchus pacificus]|uniref:Integrase_H2C2 domain-containing protein n=1 Tax=Pristionchus pacificus TaxID=54126 RepID=A0A2A6BML0_PRIPA|nr:hypothetical protein PRIPAC_84455 [Pristionchus pacificus]|eukprot:PDM67088.1 hypothetical protein PRIPAC_48505 [Pristionchus pacificus]